jgi:hypothetical protein
MFGESPNIPRVIKMWDTEIFEIIEIWDFEIYDIFVHSDGAALKT